MQNQELLKHQQQHNESNPVGTSHQQGVHSHNGWMRSVSVPAAAGSMLRAETIGLHGEPTDIQNPHIEPLNRPVSILDQIRLDRLNAFYRLQELESAKMFRTKAASGKHERNESRMIGALKQERG